MTGSVHHIRDNRWRVIVYAGKDERTGKERYRSRSFRAGGKQEAAKLADEIKSALRKEIQQGQVDRQSVGGYITEWLEQNAQTKSPTTMKGYRQIAGVIVDEFGRKQMVELKLRDVRAWYARLSAAGMSQATIAHYHSVLRAICRTAWADDEVAKPATFGLKLPKADQPAMRLPTDQAMMAIISHSTGDVWVALRLALATGMRRGELVALRWADIHGRELHVARALTEVKGSVKSGPTKGRHGRAIALDDATMRMLARHRLTQIANAAQLGVEIPKRFDRQMFADLETNPKGQTPYAPSWLSHAWDRTRKAAHVKGVRLHDLRHRHATTLLEAGVPVHVVSARLGHADPAVTLRIYSHADRVQDRVAARITGRAMKALGSA